MIEAGEKFLTPQDPHVPAARGLEFSNYQPRDILGVLEKIGLPANEMERANTLVNYTAEDLVAITAITHNAVAPEADINPTAEAMKLKLPDGTVSKELMDPKERMSYFDLAADLIKELGQKLEPENITDFLERASNTLAVTILVTHPFEDGNGRTARVLAHDIREGLTDESRKAILELRKNRPTQGYKINSFVPKMDELKPTDYLRRIAAPEIPLGSSNEYHKSTADLLVTPYTNSKTKPKILDELSNIKPDDQLPNIKRIHETDHGKIFNALESLGIVITPPTKENIKKGVDRAKELITSGKAIRLLENSPFVDSNSQRDLYDSHPKKEILWLDKPIFVDPKKIMGVPGHESWAGRGRKGSAAMKHRQSGKVMTSFEVISDYATRETPLPALGADGGLSLILTKDGPVLLAENAHRVSAAKLRNEPLGVTSLEIRSA